MQRQVDAYEEFGDAEESVRLERDVAFHRNCHKDLENKSKGIPEFRAINCENVNCLDNLFCKNAALKDLERTGCRANCST